MGTTSAQRQAELRERAMGLLDNSDPAAFTAASKAQLVEAIALAAGKAPNPEAMALAARALIERIGGTLEPVIVTPDPRVAMLEADLSQANKELAEQDVKIQRMEKAHAREIKRLEKRIAELKAMNDSLGDSYSKAALELDHLKRPNPDPVTVTGGGKPASRHKRSTPGAGPTC